MTRYFYDTEFLDNGHTIELISIGIVADDDREYYAVNADMPLERISKNDWLIQNVVQSLPIKSNVSLNNYIYSDPKSTQLDLELDLLSSSVKPQWLIANEVRDFLLAGSPPELWAYYSAYDHVCVAQLWGAMKDRPKAIPMWTNDIMTMATILEVSDDDLPRQEHGHHNALQDARHVKTTYQWLKDKLD